MKKTSTILFVILFLIFSTFQSSITVQASSFNISASKSSASPGETISINVSIPGGAGKFNVSASNGQIVGDSSIFVDQNENFSVKVGSSGSTTITVTSVDIANSSGELPNTSKRLTVNVVKPTPAPSPGGNNSGNSNSGNSNSGNTNSGNTSNKPSKTPEQIEAEKKAAEEAAKKAKEEAEKLEKEKVEKTPLFKEIEIISLDQVLHGQNVGTIKAEFNKNSYEFTLPKYINKYKLQVNTDESGVEFVFDEEHDFTDSKDVSKTIDLRAVKGDLSQSFTVKVNKNTEVDAVRKHEDKEYNVFSSDKLEEFMKARGYIKKEHDVDGVKSYYFEKDKLKVQLLFDDKLNGKWFILDDKLEFGNEVILIDLKNDLFFVDEAPEELAQKSIEENKYSEKTIDYASLYTDIHQGLVMNNKYKSWEVEDTGEIVYGIKSDGVEGTYLLAGKLPSDAKVEKAFISFGSNDSKYQKISWALGGTLFALIGTGGFLQLSKKKKED